MGHYLPMSLATKKMVKRYAKKEKEDVVLEDDDGEIDLFSRSSEFPLYLIVVKIVHMARVCRDTQRTTTYSCYYQETGWKVGPAEGQSPQVES